MANLLARLGDYALDWRDAGREGRVALILRDIRNGLYYAQDYWLMQRSLEPPLPHLPPKIPLEIRPLTTADLATVGRMSRASEARIAARRLQAGQRGFIALYEGRAAGYAWAAARVDPALERVRLELEPGEMFCAEAFVLPAYRSLGIQTALIARRLQSYRERGYTRALSMIAVDNGPSLRAWSKVGAEAAGRVRYQRIALWRRAFIGRL